MKIIHFADLHLGVENYGRIDPATGLSSRLNDFLSALDHLVDYALENRIDLIIFCGDAYKTREPTPTQQRELAKRIARLSEGGIPVFLLTGNHDLPNAFGRATATEIFDTLAVKNIYVANRPDIYKIQTASGPVQIIALPWLKRSALLSREDMKTLNAEQVRQKMQQVLTDIINSKVSELSPDIPSVLAAHVWVTGAQVGSEGLMSIGQEHSLLLSSVAQPELDYVALGHIHKRQVLSENPPVVYAGSLERVDFGEENEGKGFYVVVISQASSEKGRQVSFEFHPVKGRSFLTIEATLSPDDIDPTATLLKTIAEQNSAIDEAVVRFNITAPASIASLIRDSELRNVLQAAHHLTISKKVIREARFRLGNISSEELTPLQALTNYLESQKISAEKKIELLEYGKKLLNSLSAS